MAPVVRSRSGRLPQGGSLPGPLAPAMPYLSGRTSRPSESRAGTPVPRVYHRLRAPHCRQHADRSGGAAAPKTSPLVVEIDGPSHEVHEQRPDSTESDLIRRTTLGDISLADLVRIDCPRCDRAGSYRRDGLMARFGADIALPDLLLALASCERRKDFSKPCGARFTNLAVASPLAIGCDREPARPETYLDRSDLV